MALALVQSGADEVTSSLDAVVTLNLTSGNSLIAIYVWRGTSTVTSVTTNHSQTLTSTGTSVYNSIGDMTAQMFYLGNVTTTGSTTITGVLNPGGTARSLYIYEISGGNTSSFFDKQVNANGLTGDPTLSLTTANNNETIFAVAIGDFGTGNLGATGTGYVLIDMANIWSYNDGEYNLGVGSAGSKTVTMTSPGSTTWVLKAAAFNSGATATDFPITAAYGSYTCSGQNTGLHLGRKMAAVQGAYTNTGQTANVLKGRFIVASNGNYTLIGSNGTSDLSVPSAQSTYTLTGKAAILGRLPRLTASQGLYNSTGQDIVLSTPSGLTATHGTYALTGKASLLIKGPLLVPVTGQYHTTGKDTIFGTTGTVAPSRKHFRKPGFFRYL